MRPRVAHILLAALLPAAALGQGVPTNDSGLTARDIVETGDRDADLAVQREKLTVEELLTEIEREQLATLRAILDAQTSFGGQGLPGMVADFEGGGGDPDRSAAAVYGSGDVDPNPGGAGMFGDAAENIEQLIIRVAQETHGRPGVGRAGLSVVQWRALLQALIWQESRFSIGARSPVGAFGLTQIMPGTASDLGINPEYYDSPYLQVEGGARYLAAQLTTFDGNVVNALAAYNAGPGRVFEYGGVPPFKETQHYIRVIPERYNLYLARIGGIEALGTIDPALLTNANLSFSGFGAAFYGSNSPAAIRQAALRVQDIVTMIGATQDIQESMALNTYARAELVRLMAARIRLKAARTQPLSAAQLAQAAARMVENEFMEFTLEDLD
ncbi:Transglycosylase SLT domain-containing protein [Thalassovita litoralis]|uniref:Transglycosylase SLT domain-containing protein n=3 Tax=Rhodobacterales TaxID=204455 RepID=A0A521F528_9RHOB|nr:MULTISPECIES: lytic transglycosylase domain-containing protein [Rhodobacterales]MBV7380857.1 lytic transglycosylase domain-containing protein [Maritimibacter dapengensis]MDK3020869.1 lytic transglycosylase domain-containing protein [Pseudodonghicola flavimaris]SMO91275.1 Transglycosylase SLT domain-containing protein [Thalassovita litoralis]